MSIADRSASALRTQRARARVRHAVVVSLLAPEVVFLTNERVNYSTTPSPALAFDETLHRHAPHLGRDSRVWVRRLGPQDFAMRSVERVVRRVVRSVVRSVVREKCNVT